MEKHTRTRNMRMTSFFRNETLRVIHDDEPSIPGVSLRIHTRGTQSIFRAFSQRTMRAT